MITHGTVSVEPVGSTGWIRSVTHTYHVNVNMVNVNGTELVWTIKLPITDHANTYALALSYFPAPQAKQLCQ